MTLSPCIVCGQLADGTRCPDHRLASAPKAPTDTRGYDWEWQQLSQRARKLQPFCLDCGSTDDLTADHSPEAWARKAAGKAIRLRDVAVVCRPCNSKRGRARPADDNLASPTGVRPHVGLPDPLGKAEFRSHTPGGIR